MSNRRDKTVLRWRLAHLMILVMPFVALYPVIRTMADWVTVSRVTNSRGLGAMTRAYDWISWQDEDGSIRAEYVHPSGPAARAGIEAGDIFYLLDFQQYFNALDLTLATEGLKPGSTVEYTVVRGTRHLDATFPTTRYPTFLYPTSGTLWRFSMWGFAIAALFHILGLIVATPLARRSTAARFSAVLIATSALWIVGNLVRIVAIDLFGPPSPGSRFDLVFQATTLVSLFGWIAFPVLLVRKVVGSGWAGLSTGLNRVIVFVPTLVLGLIAFAAAAAGGVGPFSLDELVSPILFYASCYIALSAALILLLRHVPDRSETAEQWNVTGSSITLAVSLFAALLILGIVPVVRPTSESSAGWFVVATQLLSTAPVILVSLATLRYGKFDQVIRRTLALVSSLGVFFLLFVAGLGLIERAVGRTSPARNIAVGLFAVVLVFLIERIAAGLSRYFTEWLPSERRRAGQILGEFQARIPNIMVLESLLTEAVTLVGEAFAARSAVAFVKVEESDRDDEWLSYTYHPEPPYLTESFFKTIWPYLKDEARIWAYNPALNSSDVPESVSSQLIAHGAALAIPIVGRVEPAGVIVLGRKRDRRSVYNLEDLEQIRWLCGQLGLAIDRLRLIEHQKSLARETTQAQLVALRAQINPHFLFNTLNTIAALIAEKPEQAEATVEQLSSIFRHTLQARDETFIPLSDEIALVKNYLSIEQVRFGKKLKVEIDVPSSLGIIPVPAFVVQTLVENSVKHGIERKLGGGQVHIRATQTADHFLSIVVSDTGIGIPVLFNGEAEDRTDFYGIGLSNISVRLENLYGRSDLIRIASTPDTGTTVELSIPVNKRQADNS
ncbi:MAG: histidine kinase [Rhodothermales bacterium]